MNNWKDRLGIVFSTNPDFKYQQEEETTLETLSPAKQKLRVFLEKKGRAGKTVTIIKGFVGTKEDCRKLEKMLKSKCGVGGSSNDDEILLQGQLREKVILILKDLGYTDTK